VQLYSSDDLVAYATGTYAILTMQQVEKLWLSQVDIK
jgi:hypothetical protein